MVVQHKLVFIEQMEIGSNFRTGVAAIIQGALVHQKCRAILWAITFLKAWIIITRDGTLEMALIIIQAVIISTILAPAVVVDLKVHRQNQSNSFILSLVLEEWEEYIAIINFRQVLIPTKKDFIRRLAYQN